EGRRDQRRVQLIERERIVEERRVEHRARDRDFTAVHHYDLTPSAAAQAPVRHSSVPSVAHAAPSIESQGISHAFSARLTTSAMPQMAAYARSRCQPTS